MTTAITYYIFLYILNSNLLPDIDLILIHQYQNGYLTVDTRSDKWNKWNTCGLKRDLRRFIDVRVV